MSAITKPILDVAVISPQSLLVEGIAALVKALGYRVAISEPSAPHLAAKILIVISPQDVMHCKRSADRDGSKIVLLLNESNPRYDSVVDGRLDLSSTREDLASVLGTLLAHPRSTTCRLSPAEKRIVAGYVSGLTQPELARRFFLAPGTVATHLSRARQKYHDDGRPASTKIDLLMRAIEDDVVSCPCESRNRSTST